MVCRQQVLNVNPTRLYSLFIDRMYQMGFLTGEIEYHPILVPISSSPTNPSIDSSKPLTGAENVKTWNQSRRPSQDSGFFNVPTPPGSFSESSSSPSNTPSMLLDFNSIPPPPEDLELDKIVDDVDDMFREQLDKKAQEDLEENISLIKRNLPAKKDGQITSFLRQTTQDIADQIARNLVDRALELDRKRLVKKIAKSRKTKTTKGGARNCNEDEEDQEGQDQGSLLLESERSLMLSNFVEVAINRVTEQIISDLLQNAKNDMANVLHHKFNGMSEQDHSVGKSHKKSHFSTLRANQSQCNVTRFARNVVK